MPLGFNPEFEFFGMSTPPVVTLLKHGGMLVIAAPSDDLKRILEQTLCYRKLILPKSGRSRGRQVRPIDCYKYVQDPDGLFPEQFWCGAGYIRRVTQVLRSYGYSVQVRDMLPPADPSIFVPQWDRLKDFEWRYKQRYCLEQLLKRNYGQIDCPVGYGKSTLMRLIPRLLPKAKIAFTTMSVDVINAIYEELAQMYPDVGIRTSKNNRRGRRINCYSLKSLDHCKDPVDILLIDEIYESATDDSMALLMGPGVANARKYGFGDNTTDRIDGAHFELEGIVGPVVVNIPYQEAVEHGAIAPIQVRWVDVVMDKDPAENLQHPVAIERTAIWRNQYRNEQIAKVARTFKDDEQVLITVFSVEHGLRLRKLLPEFQFCYSDGAFNIENSAEKLGRYIKWGLMDPAEPLMTWDHREWMRKRFESGKLKKVIATGVWKRGVNFRRLQVLIRADAHSSMIENTQIPGRCSRLCDETGKQFGLIIDFRDQFSKKYRRDAQRRRADYQSHGWKQTNDSQETMFQRMLQYDVF